MKRISSIMLIAVLFVFVFIPVKAYATVIENTQTKIELTVEDMTTNAYAFIEQALQYARDNATDESPVTVILPSGEYDLSGCLHIYSNTNLILQSDTVLTKTSEDGNMIKAGLQSESNSGYEGYKNIKISGGVWDEDFCGDSCGMRFAHCSNITIENLTIKNNYNSHHLEIAAAEDFRINNCTFSGYKRSNSGDGMAVQIDIMHNTSHFPSYYYYDDTPCRNITVSGCNFYNVYSGVGSYSGVVGSYFNNIRIEKNYFEKVKDKGIALFNAVNSSIKNNTVKYATIGILFEYYPFDGTSRLYKPNDSSASRNVIYDTRCTISDNRITVYKYVSRYNSSGIAVYGGSLSDSKRKSYKLSTNNLIVKNLLIYNNQIKVTSSKSYGMWLQYLYSSNVLGNSIASYSNAAGGYNGVTLYYSRSNIIKNNAISKFDNSIALKSYSKKNDFHSNVFKNASGYGCAVDDTSSGYLNYGNSIKKAKKGKVLIRENTYGLFNANLKKLRVENKELHWTRYKNSSGYIVYRSTKKNSGYEKVKTVKEKEKFKEKKKKNPDGKTEVIKKEIKDRKFVDKTAKKGKKYYYKITVYRKYKGSYIYGSTSAPFKIKY